MAMSTRDLPPGIAIRAIRATDFAGLERFYLDLSPDSTDARFHGASRGIPDDAARDFCSQDHVHREGLVAVTRDDAGTEQMVAHLCLEPTPHGDVEMGIAVADAWQRRGIGRALLASAVDRARGHGSNSVRAAVRWSNPAIMGLPRSVDLPMAVRSDDPGDLEAVIDLTGALPAAV